jgi:hypothetical protein
MTLDDYAALSRKRRAVMGLPSWGEPSTEHRGLCLIGGCVMRDGACLNCGAQHTNRSEA